MWGSNGRTGLLRYIASRYIVREERGLMKNDPYVLATFLKTKEFQDTLTDGTNPIVTISRECGANGEEIAFRAGELLTELDENNQPWMVMDRELGERVINDHHLPKQIGTFFSGEQMLSLEEHLEGLLGISVPAATMIKKMTGTIIQLARMGHVIFIGRAAHCITAKFPCAAHVRIIGSFDRRVDRVAKKSHCSLDQAAKEVRTVDEQRRRFASTYFQSDLDDPLNYDLVLNTDRVSIEEGASLIAHLVSSPKFRSGKAEELRELRQLVLH